MIFDATELQTKPVRQDVEPVQSVRPTWAAAINLNVQRIAFPAKETGVRTINKQVQHTFMILNSFDDFGTDDGIVFACARAKTPSALMVVSTSS